MRYMSDEVHTEGWWEDQGKKQLSKITQTVSKQSYDKMKHDRDEKYEENETLKANASSMLVQNLR